MSLRAALTDARTEIEAGTSLDDAAQIAASEYALNPALIIRKLCEQYQASPDSVESAIRERKISQTYASALADASARRAAEHAQSVQEAKWIAEYLLQALTKD